MAHFPIHHTKGMLTVKDKDGNTSMVNTNDPRYLSGKLNAIRKNCILVKDSKGNSMVVDKTDERYLSGELIPLSRGRKFTQENVICPYCEMKGGKGSMKRWHFDNCKFKYS